MNGLPPVRRWIAALVAVIAGGAGMPAAQQGPINIRTSDTAPARDILADTKRELDAIRALRDPAQQGRPDSPRVGAPEWHGPSGGAPAPVLRPARPVAIETKNANWLVDAMQPAAKDRERPLGERGQSHLKSPRSDRLEQAEETGRLRPGERPTESAARRDAERESEDRARDRSTGVDPAAVNNPLNQYLEGWMSPQDFALLAPGILPNGKTGVDALSGSRPGDAATTGTFVPPGVGLDASFGLRAPPNGLIDRTPRENPFLQSLATPVPGAASGVPAPKPIAPPPVITAPAAALNPAPVATPPPRTPDFARPANDEKYFKPLKRF